jgi:hypothetical protein
VKEKDEAKLSRVLFGMQGEGNVSFPWGKVKIEVKYINYSAGGEGCPDSLLILKTHIPILGRLVSVQMPILIEAEKAGMEAAMQDLEKFCTRSMRGAFENGSSSFIEIPMIVATKRPRTIEKEESRNLKATFRVCETKL